MPYDAHRETHGVPPGPSRPWDNVKGLGQELWQRHAISMGMLTGRITKSSAQLHNGLRHSRILFLSRLLSRWGPAATPLFSLSDLPLLAFPARRSLTPGLGNQPDANLVLSPSQLLYRPAYRYLASSLSSGLHLVNSPPIQRALSKSTGSVIAWTIEGADTSTVPQAHGRTASLGLEPAPMRSFFRQQSTSPRLLQRAPWPSESSVRSSVTPPSSEAKQRGAEPTVAHLGAGALPSVSADLIEQRVRQREAPHHAPDNVFAHGYNIALSQTAKFQAAVHRDISQPSLFVNGKPLSVGIWPRVQRSPGLPQRTETSSSEQFASLHFSSWGRPYEAFQTPLARAHFQGSSFSFKPMREFMRFSTLPKVGPVQRLGIEGGVSLPFERTRTPGAGADITLSAQFVPPEHRAIPDDFAISRDTVVGDFPRNRKTSPPQPGFTGIFQVDRMPVLTTRKGIALSYRQLFLSETAPHRAPNAEYAGIRPISVALAQRNALAGGSPGAVVAGEVVLPAVVQGPKISSCLPNTPSFQPWIGWKPEAQTPSIGLDFVHSLYGMTTCVDTSAQGLGVKPLVTAQGIRMRSSLGSHYQALALVQRRALAARSVAPTIADALVLPTVTQVFGSKPLAMAKRIFPYSPLQEGGLALKRSLSNIGQVGPRDGRAISLSPIAHGVGDTVPLQEDGLMLGRSFSNVEWTERGSRACLQTHHGPAPLLDPALSESRVRATLQTRPSEASQPAEKGLWQKSPPDDLLRRHAKRFTELPAITLRQPQAYRLSRDRSGPLISSQGGNLPALARLSIPARRLVSESGVSPAVQLVRAAHAISVQIARAAQRPQLVATAPDLSSVPKAVFPTAIGLQFAQGFHRGGGEDKVSLQSLGNLPLSMPLVPPPTIGAHAAFLLDQSPSHISIQTSPQPVSSPSPGLPSATPMQTPAAPTPGAGGSPTQVDIDDLVEKAWRKLLHKLTVEQERRGWTRWT
jgi:hypothetical protein